jgi:hypothetical protein
MNSPLNLPACWVDSRAIRGLECSRFEGELRMFPGRTLLLLGLGLSLCLTTLAATGAGLLRPAIEFPLPVDSYHDQQIPSLSGKLAGRVQMEPLNLVATIIFFGAIVHTFLTDALSSRENADKICERRSSLSSPQSLQLALRFSAI